MALELLAAAFGFCAALLLALVARFVWIVGRRRSRPYSPPSSRQPARTLVVLGSGGHTAEMLMLLDKLDPAAYSPRTYVVAETDRMSGQKALQRELNVVQATAPLAGDKAQQQSGTGRHKTGGEPPSSSPSSAATIVRIPRSREVGQSYVTSVFTTLYSLLFAAAAVLRTRPQLVLVNGPGTCIPICAAALLYRLLGVLDVRIAYVESIARTRRLSLSGRILYATRAADVLFVQWEDLLVAYPRATYAGRLY